MINRFSAVQITNLLITLLTISGFSQPVRLNSSSDYFIPDPDISANGDIRVVLISDSILYIGGNFTRVTDKRGSHSRNGLAAINLKQGRVTRFRADINRGTVRAIAFHNGRLYAGGTFSKINNISRSKIAAIDPVTGDVLITFGDERNDINGPVFALACLDEKLFAGGNFKTYPMIHIII